MNKNQKLYPFKFDSKCTILDENSTIINGFLSENTIDDVLDTYLGEIIGNDNFQYYKGIFPIKISFTQTDPNGLAPQLHPNDATALERYMSIGKAKLWYITKSTPKTQLYLGFNNEMDATTFYNNCMNGSIINDLHPIKPKAGDYIYIKPGYVHAVKGEIEFIEISQNSEITYHLTGEDASLEIAEAIDIIDYSPVNESALRATGIDGNTTIANTSAFIVNHIALKQPISKQPQESFIIYVCLHGNANIISNGTDYNFGKGEMVLVPAGMNEFTLLDKNGEGGKTKLLEIYLPKVADIEEDLYMNYYEDDSNYPTGSGTDPEDDNEGDYKDDACDDDCDDNCDNAHCHCNSHNCHCQEHKHEHEENHMEPEDEHQHPGEFFFKRK